MQLDLIPTPRQVAFRLRDYQSECVAAILRSLIVNRSTMVVMATGLGKSVVVSSIVAGWPGRVMVIAHREELIAQMAEHLARDCGEPVEFEQRSLRATQGRIVVASIQTLTRGDRFERFDRDEFSLIVCDEFHHYVAKTFRKPLEYFHGKLLGVTATPDRGDERALGAIVDDVAYSMDIEDGIDRGYLVPIRARAVELHGVELDHVGTSAGDLKQGELDDEMVKGVDAIVSETLKYEAGRKGIAFFPGCASAELACAAFNAKLPGSAVYLNAKTDPDERKQIVRDFKAGKHLYLCNVGIATEGFDDPEVSLIIQARPTKSRALYAQMAGRGTRPVPGILDGVDGNDGRAASIHASRKPDCVILDFVGNCTKHKLVSAADALAGNYSAQEIALAKKKADKGKDGEAIDLLQALKGARLELQRQVRQMRGRYKSTVVDIDPFRFAGCSTSELKKLDSRYASSPASPLQIELLKKRGFGDAELHGMTKRAASQLIDSMQRRMQANVASLKQLRALSKYTAVSPDTTFRAASNALNYLASKAWGRGPGFSKRHLDSLLTGELDMEN
jgi:superfamily II DNA or RNA helicase